MLILSQNVHNQLVNLQILKPEHQTEQRSHRSTNICFYTSENLFNICPKREPA